MYLYDLELSRLKELMTSLGEPEYRANQIWQGIYLNYQNDFDQLTNLPISLRHQLSDLISFSHLRPIAKRESADGQTVKTLFQLPDGFAIEAVLMKYHKRRTLCISCQAGCGMGCVFCATGQMGLKRNLSRGEIVEQVLYYARELNNAHERVTNIVIMGMG